MEPNKVNENKNSAVEKSNIANNLDTSDIKEVEKLNEFYIVN